MHFADLAKRAFVQAAGDISRFRNGKLNQSRIAVITGLHRSEVKRLIEGRHDQVAVEGSRASRTERVIIGWNSDRRFLDENGKPRKLSITTRRNSFADLVRSYAGDVPHRAVLDELKRSGVVSQTDSFLELDPHSLSKSRRIPRSFSETIPVLLDALRLAGSNERTGESMPLHRLTLIARDSIQLAVLRERLESAASSTVSGLKSALRGTRRGRGRYSITLTAFIQEQKVFKK